jgi:putative IMPACT (imprinted ancient) family translation regulator
VKVERVSLCVTVSYPEVDGMQRLIDEMELIVLGEEFSAEVRYELGVPTTEADELRRRVGDLTRGSGQVEEMDR